MLSEQINTMFWPATTSLLGFNLGICLISLAKFFPEPFFTLHTFGLLTTLVASAYLILLYIVVPCSISFLRKLTYISPISCPNSTNLSHAFSLGMVFGLGILLTVRSNELATPRALWPYAIYLCFLTFFHWSEFYVAALTQPSRISTELYMLNHSPEYLLACLFSFLEYFFEVWIWPAKSTSFLFLNQLGILICVAGETLRKFAMLTAADNFSHYVEHTRRQEHVLVRHGVYAWCRHPAYAGWFYWSLGTQLLLLNPVCSVAFPLAAYFFFKDRIDSEEESLIYFFGDEYRQYQAEVPTGLPFMNGYLQKE